MTLHPEHPAFDRADLLIHTPDRTLENECSADATKPAPVTRA